MQGLGEFSFPDQFENMLATTAPSRRAGRGFSNVGRCLLKKSEVYLRGAIKGFAFDDRRHPANLSDVFPSGRPGPALDRTVPFLINSKA